MSGLATAPSGATGSRLGPLGGLLERFRRTSGVPAAASEDVEAELLPVFAALAAAEAEADRLIAGARDEAARRTDAAEREAARLLSETSRHAAAERARAEASVQARAAEEAAAVTAAAAVEADGVLARGRPRIPRLAHELVGALFEEEP